jgi:hypothetical protein
MTMKRYLSEDRPTMSVPQAGRHFFGLGEQASYRAAARREIPCVRIGNRMFASVPAIQLMLMEAGRTHRAELRLPEMAGDDITVMPPEPEAAKNRPAGDEPAGRLQAKSKPRQ